ncbi:MAG TPA: hypothetical protein VFU43_11830 [Streptosporangiaceae bacterium]|nr:hypothetical protein [Streptosporangiaceae bacterium]
MVLQGFEHGVERGFRTRDIFGEYLIERETFTFGIVGQFPPDALGVIILFATARDTHIAVDCRSHWIPSGVWIPA